MRLSKLTARFRKPLAVRRVRGHSMEPTLQDGQLVVFSSLKKQAHKEIVLAQAAEKQLVKRLHVTDGRLDLLGDNIADSHDMRDVCDNSVTAGLIYPHR